MFCVGIQVSKKPNIISLFPSLEINEFLGFFPHIILIWFECLKKITGKKACDKMILTGPI